MYQDPKRVRAKHTVYLDEYETAIIQAHANYLGVPKAEVMRQMMLKEAREVLGIDPAGFDTTVAGNAREAQRHIHRACEVAHADPRHPDRSAAR